LFFPVYQSFLFRGLLQSFHCRDKAAGACWPAAFAFLPVCESTAFVKMLPELAEVLAGAEIALPYEGGKLHYILDMENRELVQTVVGILEPITPLPNRKKGKGI